MIANLWFCDLIANTSKKFSHTEHVFINIGYAWNIQNQGNIAKAIEFLNSFIENEECFDVDKIHYLVARSIFHISQRDLASYAEDIKLLKKFSEGSEQCAEELFSHYEISFL